MGGIHHYLVDPRYGDSPIHRLDPRAKIIGFLGLTIVSVSTPPTAVWAFGAYLAVLLFALGLSQLPAGYVLRRVLVVLPLVLVVAVFLPFFDRSGSGSYNVGGLEVSARGLVVLWNVTAKATLGVFSAVLLISTTSFPELVQGLERLRLPRVFTQIVGFAYRYAALFLEEGARMRRAMQSRNYRGRWLWQAGTVGALISSLFVRSYARGERIYTAMLSRGYDGTIPAAAPLALGTRDIGFLAAMGVVLATIRVSAGL